MSDKPKRITVRELYDLYLKCIAETEQLRRELTARWTQKPPPP